MNTGGTKVKMLSAAGMTTLAVGLKFVATTNTGHDDRYWRIEYFEC
jgi:hypothetical protein